MSKITLTDVENLENQVTAVATINTNNTAIENLFDNTLSRDGTAPNTMLASLDMNSHKIINLPAPASDLEPARLAEINQLQAGQLVLAGPTPTTLGGVNSYSPVTHQFLTSVSTGGAFSSAQPSSSDISGLGTAATLNVGTGANNIVQLTAASKLPAVDGSLLTNLATDFYTPETYGAVGDGITDDRAAIQSCLNAAATAGKPVLFADKTYAIDATTTGLVLDGTTGAPPFILFSGTTLKQTAGTNKTLTISNIQNAASYKGFETIGRVMIDGNSLATNCVYIHGLQPTGTGIAAVISGISVKSSTSIGFNVIGEPSYGVYGNHFKDISAASCGAQGFQFSSINNTSNYYVQANVCTNLYASGNVGGMYVDYAGCTFVNFWAESNTGAGISLNHTQDIVFIGGHNEANMLAAVDTSIQGTSSVSQGVKLFGMRTTGAVTNLYGGTNNTIIPCAIGYTTTGSTDAAGFDILRPNQIAMGSATPTGVNSINVPSTSANYLQFMIDNNGAAQFRGDGALFSGNTALWLTYHNGTVQRLVNVTLGASDSGGSGFKVLRVPN